MLEGTLDTFTLTEILRLLASTRKTGCLHVRGRQDQGRVWLRDGEVQHAALGGRSLTLSRRLVGAGLVTVDDIRQALPPEGDELQLSTRLVEEGVLEADTVEALRRQQIEDAAFDLMRWDAGTFRFDSTADELTVPAMSVEDLLEDCRRRLDEWEDLRSALPDRNAVIGLTPALADARDQVELSLAADEWRLLTLVDGRRTVGQLAELSGQGEFRTCTLLIGLVNAGLLEVRTEGAASDLPRQQELLRQLEQEIAGSQPGPARPRPAAGEGPSGASGPLDGELIQPLTGPRPATVSAPPPGAPRGGNVARRMEIDVEPAVIDRLIEGVKGL